MTTISLTFEGKNYSNWMPEDIIAAGVPEVIVLKQQLQETNKSKIRGMVNSSVGDTESLVGITSDAATLAIYGMASISVALANANNLADVRSAVEPFAALSTDFLGKIEAGEIVLPFMLKGIDAVVAEIGGSATKVSEALRSVQS